jgi:predicted PurR-regulated permease PerM
MALVLLVFAVVQAIQDLILTPKIMGSMMGLNPAAILLSLSIWGSLLGFIVLIIALPLSTIIIMYYKDYIARDELQQQKESEEKIEEDSNSKKIEQKTK